MIDFTKATSRNRLPSGRPQEVPNLVETKQAKGESIDAEKVVKAFNSLGHT